MSDSIHNRVAQAEPNGLAVEGDFPIDHELVDKFPAGTRIISATRLRTSAWAVTARLDVELADGSQECYFLKCAIEDTGRLLMEGEFNAMSELYKWAPDLVPKPHSWGKYRDGHPETYFFLSEFVVMHNTMPEPHTLALKLACLHETSVSPNGQFGFHITTCQGQVPQDVSWEPTWTGFFTKLLRHVMDLDFRTNGYWEDLDTLEKRIIDHIIPRLIGALERDGRSVKPSLIHADLWEGNTGTSPETKKIYIFDSGAFYAHHEMEIGNWRCRYNKISKDIYTQAYNRYQKASEPADEWDDRNRLYCIYFNVIYSVNHKGEGKAVRQNAYDDMYHLIDKFAPFAEGEGPRRLTQEERASLSAERDHTLD